MADMTPAQFHDWQSLLEERTGVVINEQRRSFLQTNLTARMRELGVDDYTLYFRQVTDGPRGAVEWSTLLDRLTVQETRFFRHGPSFDLLGSYLRERVAKGLDSPSPSGASVVPAAKSRTPWPSRPPRPSRAASGPTILV